MGTLTAYSISVSIVMIILWLIFHFLLAQENQPRFNRVVLLGIYTLSFMAPLLPYIQKVVTYSHNNETFQAISLGNITAELVEPLEITQVANNTFATIIVMIYLLGVAVSLVNTLVGGLKIYRLISNYGYQTIDNTKLVITDSDEYSATFSFMNYIVISRKDYESAGANLIITHEIQHIKLKHPVDVILAQLCVIFCWYNPASYLLRSELRDTHEYQADMAVLNSGADAQQYQILLIKKAVGKKFPAIANSFNHSKLKKRLTMMSNKKNLSRGAKMRALAFVPALGLTILALNCTPVVNALSKISDADNFKEIFSAKIDDKITSNPADNQIMVVEKVESSSPVATLDKGVDLEVPQTHSTITNDEKQVLESVQVMPHFPGGEKALMEFIAQNIQYPKSDTETSKTVRVIVRFVVEANGKIGETNIVRGGPEPFNEEALRVVKMLPDFEPGEINDKPVAVWYSLPIIFRQKAETENLSTTNNKTKETDNNKVFTSVQQMPQFPGGELALLKYIAGNIHYPKSETASGRVVVSFVVEKDGKIGEVKIIRKVSDAIDEEAIRVVKTLPDFIPGKENGKNVAVWYNVPISFKNNNNQKTE